MATEFIQESNNHRPLNFLSAKDLEVPVTETQVITQNRPLNFLSAKDLEVPVTETQVITQNRPLDFLSAKDLEVPVTETPVTQTPTQVITQNRPLNFLGAKDLEVPVTETPLAQTPTQVITQNRPLNFLGAKDLEVPVTETPLAQNDNQEVKQEQSSTEDDKWFVTVYGGVGTNSTLGESLRFKTNKFYDSFFNDEYFIGIEGGRKLLRVNRNISLEAIGQLRQHVGERGYLALESALLLRYKLFPGNSFLNTSLAVGDGLSYVTQLPGVEAERPEGFFAKSNLLNYLLIEATFSLPKNPSWSLVLRLNHRSGIYGLFNGARDGSNNYALGIRHSF
ncbi:MAG: hypothetical protein KME08_12400 [Aphanothece sp. CMT-3BRIN-NPC111]|nr:hypothetical protein [Aphanothece sp. CMT-3BRIN-NPC111]